MNQLNEIRELWRRPGVLEQHSISGVTRLLKAGMYSFTSIKHGNINKKEGDIVIINCKDGLISLSEHLNYFLFIDNIEIHGIYTNIYFSKEYFPMLIYRIIHS